MYDNVFDNLAINLHKIAVEKGFWGSPEDHDAINDIFIAKLIRAGYQGKTDVDLVDQWFQSICRNVVLESFEQQQADPEKRDNRKIIGDGRSEIS